MTPLQVAGFVNKVLLPTYDDPVTIPKFHMDLWERCCSDDRFVAMACPRGFAKSTAVTLAYSLASALLREKRYIIIISDTEDQAIEFLASIKMQLKENELLRKYFPIRQFTKDGSTDFIVEMMDGYRFRYLAKGAGQKIRGRLWGGTRPDLVIGDDLENDEMVESSDRRDKLYGWMLRAVIPALSRRGKIRIVGTILHMDSLLSRLLKSNSWNSILYKAHKSFDNFSNLLWPELWNEAKLREIRQQYMDSNFPEGYSQEYLNDPTDQSEAFFRKVDMLPMTDEDRKKAKNYYIGVDFAISDADKADYTVFTVGGVDSAGNLYIVDVVRGRFDSLEIIDTIFKLNAAYSPELFIFEKGSIEKAIGPFLELEQSKRGVYIPHIKKTPSKDKRSRARPIQGRCKAGKVFFDKEADWYLTFEEEILQFPKGVKKDQVDSFAYIGLALNELLDAPTKQEYEDEIYNENILLFMPPAGRSLHTGY